MKGLVLIIFVFCTFNSFGQFSDSLMIKDLFYSGFCDFDFFKKNKIKKIKHYKYYYDNNVKTYSYLEYVVYLNKKENLIVQRYKKKYKEYFKEGMFGELINCYYPECSQKDSVVNLEYYDNGNVYRYYDYYYKYDSLNRVSKIGFWEVSSYWYYNFIYKKDKLDRVEEIRKYSDSLTDTLVYKFFYNSPTSFGYFLKYPAKWYRADDQYFYDISLDGKRLEMSYYYLNALSRKEIDIIED